MTTTGGPRMLRPSAVAVGVLIGLPALVVCAAIYAYGVDVPYWDEWHFVPMLARFYEGRLSLADVTGQLNEHRMIVPRLLLLAMIPLAGVAGRSLLLASPLVAAATVAGIWILLARTTDWPVGRRRLAIALCSLLAFSLVQYYNWLMAMQVAFFIPGCALVWALVAVTSRRSFAWRWLGGALAALVATGSLGNGLVLWPLVGWAGWVASPRADRSRWTLTWATLSLGVVATYFQGYEPVARHPAFVNPIAHPLQSAAFALAFLGSPFAYVGFGSPPVVAALAGAALVVTTTLAIARLARAGWSWTQLAPWVALIAYGAASALAAGVARAGFGLEHAPESRYTTLVMPAIMACAVVGAAAWAGQEEGWRRHATAVAATLALALHLGSTWSEARQMSGVRDERLQAKAGMLWMPLLRVDALLGAVHERVWLAGRDVHTLSTLGFVSAFTPESLLDRGRPRARGGVVSWHEAGATATSLHVCATAVLPSGRSPDLVVWELPGGHGQAAIRRAMRLAAPGSRCWSLAGPSAWEDALDVVTERDPALPVRAWATDARHNTILAVGTP
jgi:hypothetical protein